jgi:hypothetical protein
VRLDGPGTAQLIVDDQAARRDRWTESAVVAEPRQVRSSPVEPAAVGEVPAESAARVTDRKKERKDQKDQRDQKGRDRPPGTADDQFTRRQELTADEQRELSRLAEMDRRVKAREQAYLAASRGQARAATVRYVTGPDGQPYAVDADLDVDAGPVEGNPELTLAKAETAEAAALAAADPSPRDRLMAAQARRIADEARQKLRAQRIKQAGEQAGADEDPPTSPTGTNRRFDPRVRAYSRLDAARTGSRLSMSA